MDNVREALTREVGPFQVWQWALILVGGFLVGRAVAGQLGGRSSSSGSGPATGELFIPSGGPVVGGPDNSWRAPPDAPGGPETNAEWLRLALRRLRDADLYGSAEIDTALRRYLEGQPVTAKQAQIVGAAIDAAGPPPEGAPSMLIEPPPSSSPPPSTPPGTGQDSNGGSTTPPATPPPTTKQPKLPSGVIGYVRFGGDAVYEVRARSISWVPSRAEMTRRVGVSTWHQGSFVTNLGRAPRGYRRLPDRNTVWVDVLGAPRAVDRRQTAVQIWGSGWNDGKVGDPNTLTKATR